MRDQIKQLLADVFAIPIEELSDEATIEDVSQWDSLRHLELMLELEMKFGVSIPMVVMLELLSLEAIEDFLRTQEVKSTG